MTTRETLHRLIDELPDERAERLLQAVQDPILLSRLTAPIDDEPEADEERAAVAEAREDIARGDLISTEQLCANWDSELAGPRAVQGAS